MGIIPQLVLNSIIAGAVYTLMALGFNLIYGTTKFFNLTHGVMAAVGAYVVFFLSKQSGWNLTLSIPLAVAAAGVAGFALDKFVYLPLRKRKASNMVLLVASLGSFTAIQALIAILFTSQFQTLSRNIGSQRVYEISTGVITEIQLITLLLGAVIMSGLVLVLNKTRFGRAVKAIADDEEVAQIVGVNTNSVIGYVFFIGSAIAGLAGILVGFDTGIEPTMGMGLLLKGVIASIVGGVGNIYGGVLGAFLLGFVENFGIWQLSGEWKDTIAFAVLILFLLARPQGILGRKK